MTLGELRELAHSISQLYETEGKAFANFQNSSGLTCLSGCGACCNHPEISATIAEMLPVALHLLDRGDAQDLYRKLHETKLSDTCVFYRATSSDMTKGYCSEYQNRAVICRSFGAAALRGKNGKKVLSLCHHIKASTEINLQELSLEQAPLIDQFATRVRNLGADTTIYPINTALKKALEKVLMAESYENEYN